MNKLCFFTFFLSFCFLFAKISLADYLVILIDETSVPYSLSQNKYSNSPNKYSNSHNKYSNSSDKYSNSPNKYSNSPNKYSNGASGKNRLITKDSFYVGYYTITDDDVINLYNSDGERIAFNPNLDETQSLFHSSKEKWCGTFGSVDRKRVIGLVPSCYYRFAQ